MVSNQQPDVATSTTRPSSLASKSSSLRSVPSLNAGGYEVIAIVSTDDDGGGGGGVATDGRRRRQLVACSLGTRLNLRLSLRHNYK